MSEQRPPGRPVSHRAPVDRGETIRRLVPPLAAVAAVIIVIVLLLALNNRPSGPDAGPALVSPTATTTATTEPPATTSPSPSRTPTHRPTSVPATSTTAAVAKAPVTVLNNSRRSGLAHRAADQVAAKGWPIARIGNFSGRIAESTLYYAAGQRAVAERLAREMPAIRRVLPRFSGLPGSGLTLVVTRDWPA